MSRHLDGLFQLSFLFSDEKDEKVTELVGLGDVEVPEYVMVEEAQ